MGMGALTMGENMESLSSSIKDAASCMVLFVLLSETGMEFCAVELMGTNAGDGVRAVSKRDAGWDEGCCGCEDAVFVAAS